VEILSDLPSWAGTVPQWAMLLVVIAAAIKLIIPWRQQVIDKEVTQVAAYAAECQSLRSEVRELSTELRDCEDRCDKEIRGLHEEILGLRKNQVQEQISLINVIMRSVNNPELQSLMLMLESVQSSLKRKEGAQDGEAGS